LETTMSDDKSILTGEERAARALREALHHRAMTEPLRMDAVAWIGRAGEQRTKSVRGARRRAAFGAAAAIAALVAAGAIATWPRWGSTGASDSADPSFAVPVERFVTDTFSFDYPTSWRVLSGSYREETISDLFEVQVYGVLGTGGWSTGCRRTGTSTVCPGDEADVSGGRVVVKVSADVRRPLMPCGPGRSPNVALGPNVVWRTDGGPAAGGAITWEIGQPGGVYHGLGSVGITVWGAEDSDRLAEVEALVASFRWAPGVRASIECASTPTPDTTGYDADGISFDYPTSWGVLAPAFDTTALGPRLYFAVGTGVVSVGCRAESDGWSCFGPMVSAMADQVVVLWYRPLLHPDSARATPTGFTTTAAGRPAVLAYGPRQVTWYLSDGSYMQAQWGPDAIGAEDQARALVASLSVTGP
jgi:hypothetical protein